VDLNAMLRTQLIRERREPRSVARHERERVTVGGELTRNLESDS
jgi:hypothetical protein